MSLNFYIWRFVFLFLDPSDYSPIQKQFYMVISAFNVMHNVQTFPTAVPNLTIPNLTVFWSSTASSNFILNYVFDCFLIVTINQRIVADQVKNTVDVSMIIPRTLDPLLGSASFLLTLFFRTKFFTG